MPKIYVMKLTMNDDSQIEYDDEYFIDQDIYGLPCKPIVRKISTIKFFESEETFHKAMNNAPDRDECSIETKVLSYELKYPELEMKVPVRAIIKKLESEPNMQMLDQKLAALVKLINSSFEKKYITPIKQAILQGSISRDNSQSLYQNFFAQAIKEGAAREITEVIFDFAGLTPKRS